MGRSLVLIVLKSGRSSGFSAQQSSRQSLTKSKLFSSRSRGGLNNKRTFPFSWVRVSANASFGSFVRPVITRTTLRRTPVSPCRIAICTLPERAGVFLWIINDFPQYVRDPKSVVLSEGTFATVQLVQNDGKRINVSFLRSERRLNGRVVTT